MESKDKGLEEAQAVESNVAEKVGDMAEKVVDEVKDMGDLDKADKMAENQKDQGQEQSNNSEVSR